MRYLVYLMFVVSLLSASSALAEDVRSLGANLSKYDYPYPVERYDLSTPQGTVAMAYMDIAAQTNSDDAPTIVLLHGKNFSGAYWGDTARWLSKTGYRVIVPDQIGFGKSDKPAAYSYTFHHLAANTHQLLDSLDIHDATIVGHSMGGMLAMRYALMYPQATHQLVLVDPIGLEDWKAKGVPYRGIDAWYAREMKKDYAAIQAYQKKSYYHGTWKAAYAPWARMLAGMYNGADKNKVAWAQAATYDMVYTQPVYYEFDRIQPDTTLMIGALDKTALGKDLVSDDKAARLGNYPVLSEAAVDRMPHAKRIVFDGVGHLPFIEAPRRFKTALRDTLDNPPAAQPND